MKKRPILLALLILALTPGTWLRSPPPPVVLDAGVEVVRVPVAEARIGAFEVLGAWQLKSEHSLFHGYSALLAMGDGAYFAASDAGAVLEFSMAGGFPADFTLSPYARNRRNPDKEFADIEALARDPETGFIWAGYEGRNIVERRNAELGGARSVQPEPMARWSVNSGPEAMTRLADGRFVMLGEGTVSWSEDSFPGLLWARDPILGEAPEEFAFSTPENFRPTDMALLPDGRVLVLVRRIAWGLPPHFEVAVLVADPQEIEAGKVWSGTELARFSPPFPTDNYEGLAVEPGSGFPVEITIISDDNAVSYQRTLLLRLQWDGSLPEEE